MNAFRYKLKQHIAPLHDQLESLELMQAYVRRDCGESGYLAVLSGLYSFWSTNAPLTVRLPSAFHTLYYTYLSALADDLNQCSATVSDRPVFVHHNEIAFFYVLLGSSLGARMLLQQRSTSELPQQNLKVLAECGGSLWKEFLTDHMVDIEPAQEPEILQATENMFHNLYRIISAF